MIYLDNAATTRISPKVLKAMIPYLTEEYGNAGALYGLGRRAAEAIATSRLQVADLIDAEPEQIIFTSGGTEANNLAILGCRDYLAKIGKKHIVTSPTEHDSVLRAIDAVCKPLSCNTKKCIKDEFYTTYLPVDKYGHVSVSAFEQEVLSYDDIGLVSIMYMNNEVGAINDVERIGQICRKNNILFHTDCVQAAGIMSLDVKRISCDFMSLSSHKIHGSKGVGALYVRNKEMLSAIINGGAGQEYGMRGGTENVAGIVGFGMACELVSKYREFYNDVLIDHKLVFVDILKERLSEYNLGDILHINGQPPDLAGKTLSLTFDDVDAETLVLMCDTKGLCISAGSACRSHESKPSRTLLASGKSEDDARNTVRISFSELNEESDVVRGAQILASCVKALRSAYDEIP